MNERTKRNEILGDIFLAEGFSLLNWCAQGLNLYLWGKKISCDYMDLGLQPV
jgi:hypothetical protein